MRVKIQPIALENGLRGSCLPEVFRADDSDRITLDGQTAAVALHDQVDSKGTHAPLRSNVITGSMRRFMTSRIEGD